MKHLKFQDISGKTYVLPLDRIAIYGCAPNGCGAICYEGRLFLSKARGEDLLAAIALHSQIVEPQIGGAAKPEQRVSDEDIVLAYPPDVVNAIKYSLSCSGMYPDATPIAFNRDGKTCLVQNTSEAMVSAVANALTTIPDARKCELTEQYKKALELLASGE